MDTVFVKCKWSKGAFPHERYARVTAPEEGRYYPFLVPAQYIYDEKGVSQDRQPIPKQNVYFDGFIKGRIVGTSNDGLLLVNFPDGDTAAIQSDLVVDDGLVVA